MNMPDWDKLEPWIQQIFAANPSRLRHILVVADLVRQSARDINELGSAGPVDEGLAYGAALLHDVGYWEPIATMGFHPLDGARFLTAQGHSRAADLIVGHSTAPEEAALRGISGVSASSDTIASLITYWDMRVKQGGATVSFQERCSDIIERYGEHSVVGEALLRAKPRLEEINARVERLLQWRPG